jgi:hypothetical protein
MIRDIHKIIIDLSSETKLTIIPIRVLADHFKVSKEICMSYIRILEFAGMVTVNEMNNEVTLLR